VDAKDILCITEAAMCEIRYVTEADREFWFTLDTELSEGEFALKIRDKRGYIICDDNKTIGIMRYNLLYDTIPFLTLIYIAKYAQNKGFGRQAVSFWETEMHSLGHKMVMTSTQVDEKAQHFYRKLGYVDKGALFLDNTPFEQAQELFLLKVLTK
jgi:RimJ/RimL family protein N-acetyltransferase